MLSSLLFGRCRCRVSSHYFWKLVCLLTNNPIMFKLSLYLCEILIAPNPSHSYTISANGNKTFWFEFFIQCKFISQLQNAIYQQEINKTQPLQVGFMSEAEVTVNDGNMLFDIMSQKRKKWTSLNRHSGRLYISHKEKDTMKEDSRKMHRNHNEQKCHLMKGVLGYASLPVITSKEKRQCLHSGVLVYGSFQKLNESEHLVLKS